MPSNPKFRPPKASDPPTLVEIEWIDAQSEIDFEGPAKKAGGLVLLPTAGYHIRNGRHPQHGAFVVIAREWFRDEENGEVYTRDTTSIPVGWIRRWSVVESLRQTWPVNQGSGTSTSSTKSSQTPKGSSDPTTSVPATSAGANPSASPPANPSS